MTTDTIVQIALAVSLGLLSLVGTAVGWLVNAAFKRLMAAIEEFRAFIADTREHRAAMVAEVSHHKERLDHHQRWLEDHERRLGEDRGCAMREEGR